MSQDITQDILSQAVKDVIAKFGKMNLAELERMLHLSRQQLRHLQKNDFKLMPNGNTGKSKTTKISPFSEFINTEYLARGIKNSSVIFDALRRQGYKGSQTSVKAYIIRASKNKSLNYIRSEKRKLHFHEKLAAVDTDSTDLPDEYPDAAQMRLLIQQILDALPPRVREIFLMGKEKNMTYRQIAQELGIAEKTVENQMGTALRKIREQLRPWYDKLFVLFLLDFFA